MHVAIRISVEGVLNRAKALLPGDFFLEGIHRSSGSGLNPVWATYCICVDLGSLLQLFQSQLII